AGDTDGELARLRRTAELFERELQDAGRALSIFARIHERAPADRDALEALIRLRSAREEWPEGATAMRALLPLLSGDAAGALALRLADLAEQRLKDAQLAESALRDVYERDPGHAPTRERLKQLYEAQGADAKLVAVLADE